MKKGGIGGGNTKTGLIYEGQVDLATFLTQHKGYTVEGVNVFYNGELVAQTFKKHQFYVFLENNGIKWREHISCKLLPDNFQHTDKQRVARALEVLLETGQNITEFQDRKA